MLSRQNHHLSHPFTVAAIVFSFAIAGSITLKSQSWTPAGQMIGPLMWEFPLSLPDGTNLIGLRWVNQRNNDSLYWFEIKSLSSTPKMYERQTLGFRTILDVNDFDSDGYLDIAGIKVDNSATILWAAMSEREHSREPLPDRQSMAYGVSNRYFGDVDKDGLYDDYSAEGESAARIVWGDSTHPFTGPSYVQIIDNSNEIYPTLPPTKVVAVGLLDGNPCIVQSYQLMPESPPFYELHELNMEDLRARARKIRTTLLQKINVGENRRYGNVVLLGSGTWWLFSAYGNESGSYGLKVTAKSINLEAVAKFWKGGWQQYFGQGGRNNDQNYPRVISEGRPFVRRDLQKKVIAGLGEVQYSVYTVARITDIASAEVEILGVAVPPDSQCYESYPERMTMVPDIDDDGINDFMVTISHTVPGDKIHTRAVSLYLTSQRPVASSIDTEADTTRIVVDEGEWWRIVDGESCWTTNSVSAQLFNISGAAIATLKPTLNGTDIVIDKPRDLSQQALWLRLGHCTFRLP